MTARDPRDSVLDIAAVCPVVTCLATDSHGEHVWYRNRRPLLCRGVNVARWANAVLEQQGRDAQAQQ